MRASAHQVYRIVEVTANKRYVVLFKQLQPPNIVYRATISVRELNEMHQRIGEQQKKSYSSEMLGTAGVRLEEELRHLKLESQSLSDQLLETKRPNTQLNSTKMHSRLVEVISVWALIKKKSNEKNCRRSRRCKINWTNLFVFGITINIGEKEIW